MSADNEDFEKIVLIKSDSMAKMFSALSQFENEVTKSNSKDVGAFYQKGIKKIRKELKKSGIGEGKKAGRKKK